MRSGIGILPMVGWLEANPTFDANFDFEISYFFLCAGAGRFPGIRNLLNDAFEFAVAIRIDFYVRRVAKFYVYDIVFVNIDNSLYVAQIGDTRHFRSGDLVRCDPTLP